MLYWMTSSRRLGWNYALDRAVELATALRRPLVVLEPLRVDYPHAAERFHRFVLDGMRAHARRLAGGPARYYPYVEPRPGAGKGLLAALAARACAVVGDEWPGFFHPTMVEAAGRIPAYLELVDSAGLMPVRSADRPFSTAYSFRRFLQRTLARHLGALPRPDPLASRLPAGAVLPGSITSRWPPAAPEDLGDSRVMARLPVAHDVGPVKGLEGGPEAGRRRLEAFLATGLRRYQRERNHPEADATSGLSPYLHFGHLGAAEVFHALAARQGWALDRLAGLGTGKRNGWWGMSPGAEAFLDELVTWRELALNGAAHLPSYDRYASLPVWAQRTLQEHAADRRDPVYHIDVLERGRTHDPLWNAAQRQLMLEGRIHGYLRMLWGKKILEWSESPESALEVILTLNDRYAVDGRDPNTVAGVFWCLGRYDRPWAPPRPVFGSIRYMSSASAARKFDLDPYLARYGVENTA